MFTGIITALGTIAAVERGAGLTRLTVDSPYDPAGIALGASIAHDGVCLTVVAAHARGDGARHVVEAAAETLALTTIGALREGDLVNLERALRLGDELGGHIVQGHVDGLGAVLAVTQDGAGWRVRIRAPARAAAFIAPKGSVAVNGVSLTVNEAKGAEFGVLIVPHTWSVTALSRLKAGDKVNIEADMMARYAARLIEARKET